MIGLRAYKYVMTAAAAKIQALDFKGYPETYCYAQISLVAKIVLSLKIW